MPLKNVSKEFVWHKLFLNNGTQAAADVAYKLPLLWCINQFFWRWGVVYKLLDLGDQEKPDVQRCLRRVRS